MYQENLSFCLGIYNIIRNKHVKSEKIYMINIKA